jgi:uncharacterized protein (DUF58 family)
VTAPAACPASSTGRRFDDRFLRRLESLVLTVRRAATAGGAGIRRGRRVGGGVQFADHRDYAPGDDLRHLDWNLYGRLGRLALRTFEEDEDLSIDVLVDASASMGMGDPPKLELATQIGVALGYVGLCNLDRVAVTALGARAIGLPAARGRARIVAILRSLEAVAPDGRDPLHQSVREVLGRRPGRRRGLAILISDFYDPGGPRAALDAIRRQRLDAIAIQISAPEEIRPAVRGDVRLYDVETGRERDVTVTPAVLADYRSRHAALIRDVERACRERAAPFFVVTSDQSFDAVVLRMFRSGALLR